MANDSVRKPHPSETPEYWEMLARNERTFAKEDRGRRYGSVESIQIHLRNAADYEAQAKKLRGVCADCGEQLTSVSCLCKREG